MKIGNKQQQQHFYSYHEKKIIKDEVIHKIEPYN